MKANQFYAGLLYIFSRINDASSSSLNDIANDILSQIELFVKINESVKIEQKCLKDTYDLLKIALKANN